MWTAVLAPLAEIIKEWIGSRKEKAQAKHRAQLQVISNTAIWEQKMAEASASSWKDEWFTILLSMPIVAIIYGVIVNDEQVIHRVGLAFSQLDSLPEWYQYLLFVAVLASFGIRSADKVSALLKKR